MHDPVWEYHGHAEPAPSWHYLPLVSALSPCTATLEQAIERMAEFGAAHYAQTDVSLNEPLWRLFPTEARALAWRIADARQLCWA